MDVRQLRYFVKVVELKSITAAAEALFIAQPSLSQHMAKLESQLEGVLLKRSVQGTEPTALGELLYRHAKAILRQVDEARSAIRSELQEPSGPVAIGLPTSTSRMVAVPLLQRLRERYPKIELEMVEASSGELAEQVLGSRLDLAVTMNVRRDPRLAVDPLLQEELFAVVHPARAPAGPLSVQALAALPLLLPTHPNSVRVAAERLFTERGLALNLVAQTSAMEIMIEAVERDLGATLLPSAAFTPAQAQGRVRGVALEGRPLVRELSLSTAVPASTSPAVQCVRATVLQVIREAVEQGRWEGVRPSSGLLAHST